MNRALEDFVIEVYTQSGLSDAEFAKLAEKHFQIPITHSSVQGARETTEIKNNKPRSVNESTALAELTLRVKTLEDRVEVYLRGTRGDKKEGYV